MTHLKRLLWSLTLLLSVCVALPTALAAEAGADGVWIDVRSAEEFAAGHLDGALNIPHTRIADRIAAAVPDKNTPVHLYCGTGIRAGMALEILMEMGYDLVVNEGGYEALVAKQKDQ